MFTLAIKATRILVNRAKCSLKGRVRVNLEIGDFLRGDVEYTKFY